MMALPLGPSTRLPWESALGALWMIGVAVKLRGLPLRWTTMAMRRPPLGRVSALTSSQLLTGCPAMEMIRSPGRIPAALAGACGSDGEHAAGALPFAGTVWTHCETLLTRLVSPG